MNETSLNPFKPAPIKSEAQDIERIRKEDLSVKWVRWIRGGPLGRYTEAEVTHPTLGKTKILFGIPMSPDAVAGYVANFINPKTLRRIAENGGTANLGVLDDVSAFRHIPHRHKAKLKSEPRWSQIASAKCRKVYRLCQTIVAPPPPKPEPEGWYGDPIRDRKPE